MVHNASAMTTPELRKARLAEWIDAHIGSRTLTEFAVDISDVTAKAIDYSRLGRYRNAKLPVGPGGRVGRAKVAAGALIGAVGGLVFASDAGLWLPGGVVVGGVVGAVLMALAIRH